MEITEFQKIRHLLGKTQSDMARLLCVSHKAVQSFEQGWRNIPIYIERQMMLLLSLKKTAASMKAKPCWEIKSCPEKWSMNCIVKELGARHFCWFINGTFCQGKYQDNWKKKNELCRKCEVYLSFLK